GKSATQVVPQSIPAGADVTVPAPLEVAAGDPPLWDGCSADRPQQSTPRTPQRSASAPVPRTLQPWNLGIVSAVAQAGRRQAAAAGTAPTPRRLCSKSNETTRPGAGRGASLRVFARSEIWGHHTQHRVPTR